MRVTDLIQPELMVLTLTFGRFFNKVTKDKKTSSNTKFINKYPAISCIFYD